MHFHFLWVALSNIKGQTEDISFQQLNPVNGSVFVQILAVILASMLSKALEYFLRNLFCLKLCISSYLWSARTIQRRVLDNVRLLSDLHTGDDEFHMLGVKSLFLSKYRLQYQPSQSSTWRLHETLGKGGQIHHHRLKSTQLRWTG